VVFPHPWGALGFFPPPRNGRAFPGRVLPSSGTGGCFLQPKVCKQEPRGDSGCPPCPRHPASPGVRMLGPGAGSVRLTSSACIPQERRCTARRSGCATTATTGARPPSGPWACCSTTWCAGTSPSSTKPTSPGGSSPSGGGFLQVGTQLHGEGGDRRFWEMAPGT